MSLVQKKTYFFGFNGRSMGGGGGKRDSNFVRGRVWFTKVIYFTPVNTEYPATCGRGLHGPAGYLDNTSLPPSLPLKHLRGPRFNCLFYFVRHVHGDLRPGQTRDINFANPLLRPFYYYYERTVE